VTGLDRAEHAAVNVFFAFAPSRTYQCLVHLSLQGTELPNHMAEAARSNSSSLADLRGEIDRIDEAMHRLLMQRGDIIDRLIKVKKTQESGSAFRPAREAAMMRSLVQRHRGMLPLDTVEGIWRAIIATFTYVQAPFSVHADLSEGDARMRDSERFHFGFTVPFVAHAGAASVVAAVSGSKGDLGLVPAFATAGAGAWWSTLEFDAAPKIIARLPFVERPHHPAALPVFVISRAAPDALAKEVALWSVRLSGWNARVAQQAATLGEVIAVPDTAFDGVALLISMPEGKRIEEATSALVQCGASLRSATLVGSHARQYRIPADAGEPAAEARSRA
jgi:chorismate mutase